MCPKAVSILVPGILMRWSIRNQILIPLVGFQAIAVTAIALITATLAAARSERQIIDRLNGVIDALGHASFPYTASVLSKMRGLSGAEFIAYTDDGRASESSFETLPDIPRAPQSIPPATRLVTLRDSPTVALRGLRYFTVLVRPATSPRGVSLLVLYPEASLRQAHWEAALPSLLLGGGSLGVMALITTWIAHRISARLRGVERQVALIAEGDFQELRLGRDRDEVHDLSRSINRMCTQLREMQDTIRRSERTRLLAQLAAGLAHSLRNSVAGARMSVQLHAARHPAENGDQSLAVALRQLAITEEQVKGLLSLGRVERRPPEPCDLGQLLADVAQLVEPSCQHAKVALTYPRGQEPLEFLTDPLSVRAAVLNLALNAIDAAGNGGAVRLRAEANGSEVRIEVVDSGPGPPPELAESLYEPFVTGKPEGVGLGLALAKQVADDHGGSLSWHREDGETRFRLTLPKRDASPREETHEPHPDR
jgi:signal transduction histidine kinase